MLTTLVLNPLRILPPDKLEYTCARDKRDVPLYLSVCKLEQMWTEQAREKSHLLGLLVFSQGNFV